MYKILVVTVKIRNRKKRLNLKKIVSHKNPLNTVDRVERFLHGEPISKEKTITET